MDQRYLRKHFLEALYHTLEGVISPTPYLQIVDGASVDVRFLNGQGRLPSRNATEVTVLDIDAASLFFDDFHILYEGATGVGKTYTSDALFKTIFGSEGHYTLRLSGGVLGTSALEPFTVTALESGVPKTKIDPGKCAKYGGLFIDEINRGDSQETFQVIDQVVHVNGETGYLRIPIPGKPGKYKGLAIIAAMNPSDAQHSAALELDIAGENRFLKFKFPNGVAEAGASQLEKDVGIDLHEKFWSEFCHRTEMAGGWRELYPLVTDPQQFPAELTGETKEFIDTALGYVGSDPKETFARNVEFMQEGGITPQFSIRDDNNYKRILELQGKLKHGFVRRDLRKIKDLSRLLSFIRGVKDHSYDVSVSLTDVAASIGIILESKTITGTLDGGLITLVNDARSAYNTFRGKVYSGFGVRQALFQAALNSGRKNDFHAYMHTLDHGIANLNTAATNHAQATIKSRVLADLAVLRHFSQMHEAYITAALKSSDPVHAFNEVYQQRKNTSSIYEHRLESIIGG